MSRAASCELALPGAKKGDARVTGGADCTKFSGRQVRLLGHSFSYESSLPGHHMESQSNRESGRHGGLDGVGNRQGKGGVVVIRVDPSTIVFEYRDPSLQNLRRQSATVTLISALSVAKSTPRVCAAIKEKC